MESLDNILERLEPHIEPRRSLVQPVLAAIARRHRRWQILQQAVWVAVGLALLTVVAAAGRGNAAQVASRIVGHLDIARAHWLLAARAQAEALPWPAILSMGGFVLLAAGLRRLERLSFRLAPVAIAAAILAVVGLGAGAYAAANPQQPKGPAQTELELIINQVGRPQIIIDGHVYQFPQNVELSADQQAAYIEQVQLVRLAAQLTNASDFNAQSSQEPFFQFEQHRGRITAIAGGRISYKTDVAYESDHIYTAEPTTKTAFAVAGKPVGAKPDLKIGDNILVANFADGSTAIIAQLHFDISFYSKLPYATSYQAAAHDGSGTCMNLTSESCPNLPYSYDILQLPDMVQAGLNLPVRELYGEVVAIDATTVSLRSSSGKRWQLNLGLALTSAQRLGLNVRAGSHLRLEFMASDQVVASGNLDDPTVYAPMVPTTQPNPGLRLLNVQLALQQPWHYGLPTQQF